MSENRTRSQLIGRMLGAIGVLLAVTAGIVLLAGANMPAGDVDAVESALATATEPMVPNRTDLSAPTTASPPSSSTTSIEAETEDEPLATATSKPLSELVAESTRAPIGIEIESLGVDAPVEAYGIDQRTRQMDVPNNVRDVAWYEYGPSPGQSGSAVLAAHVDLASQGPGVFFNLKEMKPGDLVTVFFDDGDEETFVVQARNTYDKDELPLDVIFSRDGPSVLTLITCGGGFSSSNRSYDSNVVVYATPLETSAYDFNQS